MWTPILKWKIFRIESAIRQLVRSQGMLPSVWSFGAYYIDPKHLVFVVGVPSDAERDSLQSNPEFHDQLLTLLCRFNWPDTARSAVIFDIESEETVDRESGGNWWYHYK
jgi:hypothetical protein